MDYRGVFCCKNSSVFRAEEFIFMVNFDEIEFLESEIVDDDPDAPVGTLVHISDNGNSEEVSPAPTQDVSDEPIEQESVQEPETVETAQDEPVGQVIDEKDADVQDETQDVKSVEEPVEEPTLTDDAQNDETVNEAVEQTQEVETVEEPQAEDVQENVQDIATVDTVSEENVESVEERPVQDVAIEEPVEQVAQEAQQEQVAVEEPQQNVEEVNQEVASEEAVQDEAQEEVKPATPKKPRKKAVKKEEPAQDTAHVATSSTNINLKNGRNVNEALFDTSFEVEQPAKTKIVSTKKKQEKSEDLWAVAVVAKPAKTTVSKEKETKAEEQKLEAEPKKATAKKSAPKKSTKVENTQDNSTEEKKVAKATDKSTKDEAKTTKTAKATKTEPVKEEVKEVKAAKAKAPAKEEKAPKAKPVKEEVPAKETKATKATAKDDSDETVIVEGEGKMHGKYVIKKTDKGNFVFKLYSANFRVVAIGAQAYTTLGAAKIGVQSVINNAEKAPIENQTLKNYETLKFPKWEIYLDKKGEYRLRLYATNGSLIATTNDGYADISGAKNGIAAVGRASKGCAIVRNDNLW